MMQERAPNKPMVPTAPTSLAMYSRRSWRRHIGQPLGYGRRAACVASAESQREHHSGWRRP